MFIEGGRGGDYYVFRKRKLENIKEWKSWDSDYTSAIKLMKFAQ